MSSPARPWGYLRILRFWARHLLLFQLLLFAIVWVLYGSLELHGHGRDYWARSTDFWLEREPERFTRTPGIENVLFPGIAAAVASVAGIGFGEREFALLAVVPYPLFVLGVAHLVRRGRADGVLACASAAALYTSGMIPYMASWGGYVDGLSYLLFLPVLLWPRSLGVYVGAFVLQCLNHYLGAIALLLLAVLWHAVRGLDTPIEATPGAVAVGGAAAVVNRASQTGSFHAAGTAPAAAETTAGNHGRSQTAIRAIVVRIIASALILGAFIAFWHAQYPEAAGVRMQIALEKWSDPDAVLREVVGPFPWTLLSALKLTVVPVVVLMLAPLPGRRWRALVLAMPFAAAALLTLVFVDVTRVATMLVLPALLVTILVAQDRRTEPATRRRLRRALLVSASLNLLVPNYYVNNGGLHVPPPVLIHRTIDWLAGN